MNDIDVALEAIRNTTDPEQKLVHIHDLVAQMHAIIFILNDYLAAKEEMPEELECFSYFLNLIEYMSKNLQEALT